VLVAFQMALCVVLLVGAGLMIRSAVNLYSTPIGVTTANVLTMRVNLPEAKYKNPESWIEFHENLAKMLKGLPGVAMAGAASQLPLGNWIPFDVEFEGKNDDARQRPEVGGLVVSNNYFEMMQVQARRGRLFRGADGQAGPPVVLVNETFAAKFWPGEEALGRRMRLTEERHLAKFQGALEARSAGVFAIRGRAGTANVFGGENRSAPGDAGGRFPPRGTADGRKSGGV